MNLEFSVTGNGKTADPDVLRDAERDEELELEACPQCDGAPVVLGTLGTRQVLRCRQCGWTF